MIAKKAKECRASMLDLPAELLHIIMMFTRRQDLLNFVLSNKGVIMKVFKHYCMPTLTEIRLFYLNRLGKKVGEDDYDVYRRLVRSYGAVQPTLKKWEYPKEILSRVPDTEALNKLIYENCKSEVNRILIEEVFKYNKEKELPHFFIAGGFVYSIITGRFQNGGPEDVTQDIDLFVCLYGRSPESVWKDLKSILLKAEKRISEWDSGNANDSAYLKTLKFNFIKTQSSLTINTRIRNDDAKERWTTHHSRPFQIVLRQISCLEELLCLFDLDSCRFATEGKCLYSTYEGIRSLNVKSNVNFPEDKGKKNFYRRAVKYGVRGIATLFTDIHPLCSYFSFEETEKCLKKEKGNHSFRNDRDTAMNLFRDYVDQGMYHQLADITYEELEIVRIHGVDALENRQPTINPVRRGVPMMRRYYSNIKRMFRNNNVFVDNSFSRYFSEDFSSVPFKCPYKKKHLFFKYDILRCPQCSTFFKTVFQDRFCQCDVCSKENFRPFNNSISFKKIHEQTRVKTARKLCRGCDADVQVLVKQCESQRVLSPLLAVHNQSHSNTHILVIGAREGIGYELSVLMMQKTNRKVMMTTRYPNLLAKKLEEDQRLKDIRYAYEVVPFDASLPLDMLFKVLGKKEAHQSFVVFFCANARPQRFKDDEERNEHFFSLLEKEQECYSKRTVVPRIRIPGRDVYEPDDFTTLDESFRKLVGSVKSDAEFDFQECAHIYQTGKRYPGGTEENFLFQYHPERRIFENFTLQFGKDLKLEDITSTDRVALQNAVNEEAEKVNNSTPECVVKWIQSQREILRIQEKLKDSSWIVHFDTPRTKKFCEFLERMKVPLGRVQMRCVKVDAKNWFEPEEWEGEQSYTDYEQAVITVLRLCEEITKFL